jgi:opacity protein-like surface antigen
MGSLRSLRGKKSPVSRFFGSLAQSPKKLRDQNAGPRPYGPRSITLNERGAFFEKGVKNTVYSSRKTFFGGIEMKSNVFVKAAVFLLFFAGLTAGVSAQITISGGAALSRATLNMGDDATQSDTIGYGGNVYLDYLLPISIPLSLGLEVGFDNGTTSAVGIEGDKYEDKITAIPLLARVAYHFDLMPKLDLYVVGKVGYSFGKWKGDSYDWLVEDVPGLNKGYEATDPSGFSWGVDLGAAFYFTPNIGLFIEGGFDRYALTSKASGEYYDDGLPSSDDPDSSPGFSGWYSEEWEIELPFTRFLTLGISLKF